MTPEPPGDGPGRLAGQEPRRLDYPAMPPAFDAPPLTPAQRWTLAAFILFPVLLIVLVALAALRGS